MTRPAIVSGGIAIALALVVYVLSVGPATVLARKGVIGQTLFAKTYLPLEVSAHRCRPLDLFLQWYTDKWGPPAAQQLSDSTSFLAAPATTQRPAVSSAGIPNAPMPLPRGLRPAAEPMNAGTGNAGP
jgi:hypothetical protein